MAMNTAAKTSGPALLDTCLSVMIRSSVRKSPCTCLLTKFKVCLKMQNMVRKLLRCWNPGVADYVILAGAAVNLIAIAAIVAYYFSR